MSEDETDKTFVFEDTVDVEEVTHYLVVRHGPAAGRHIEVGPVPISIGRARADVKIEDRALSKRHCEVVMFRDSLIVKDLESTNGTFIDGQRVSWPAPVPVGSMVQIGETLLFHQVRTPREVAEDEQLSEEVTDIANTSEPPLRWLCLDASSVDDVDYSAAETLRSMFRILKDQGIRLVVAQVLDDVREQSRYELRQLFGEDAFYDTLEDVMEDYRQQTGS